MKKHYRFFSFFFLSSLFLVLCLGCALEPTDTTGPVDGIAIPNPSFRELDRNSNTGARYWNSKNTAFDVSVDTTVKRGSSNSLKIIGNGGREWARTFVFVEDGGVEVGAMYELTAWIRTDGAATGRLMVQFFSNPDDLTVTRDQILNTPAEQDYGRWINTNTGEGISSNGEFKELKLSFTVPDGTGYIETCPRLGETAGTAWFTDFSLERVYLTLLPGGDFEDADNIRGIPYDGYEYNPTWDGTPSAFKPGGMVSFVRDPSHPERGQVMKLTYDGGTAFGGSFNDSGQLLRREQLSVDTTYRLSGWMKLDPAHSGDGIPCIAIWDTDWVSPPGGDYANKLPAVQVKGEWEPFEYVFTSWSSTLYYILIFFGNSSNLSNAPNATDGAVYFDDLRLEVVE